MKKLLLVRIMEALSENKNELEKMYVEDAEAFVRAVYDLFKEGLIVCNPGNLSVGGDEPDVDVVDPTAFSLTFKGLYVLGYLRRK